MIINFQFAMNFITPTATHPLFYSNFNNYFLYSLLIIIMVILIILILAFLFFIRKFPK